MQTVTLLEKKNTESKQMDEASSITKILGSVSLIILNKFHLTRWRTQVFLPSMFCSFSFSSHLRMRFFFPQANILVFDNRQADFFKEGNVISV